MSDKDKKKSDLVPADLHDYEGRITKTNEFLNCRYGDKFNNFETMVFSLMMGRINPEHTEFLDEDMLVSELAERFGHAPNSLYGRLDKFSDKATQCAIDHRSADGTYKKIPFLKHFSYVSAQRAEDGRAKILWRFNDEMSDFLLGINGKETPFTVLFFERFKRLSTKYAPRIYELLQQLLAFNQRKFTLESFREKLDLEDKYKTYGVLKNKVIVPAVKDINLYTDLHVIFEEIYAGIKVVGIKFRFWIDEEFIRDVINKGQDIVETSPLTSGLYNEADFLSKMREVFEEERNLKFERKLRRLSKKDKTALLKDFETEFQLEGNGAAAIAYRKTGLEGPGVYSLFRGWACEKILPSKSSYDFAAYMASKGHPVVADDSGKYRLERPLLTET